MSFIFEKLQKMHNIIRFTNNQIYLNGLLHVVENGAKKHFQETGSHSESKDAKSDEILFNPNVFNEFKLAGNQEVSCNFFNSPFISPNIWKFC